MLPSPHTAQIRAGSPLESLRMGTAREELIWEKDNTPGPCNLASGTCPELREGLSTLQGSLASEEESGSM